MERHNKAALELLARLPDSPERDRLELEILAALGQALSGSKGWAHPETRRVLTRARELAEELRETGLLIWVLGGLSSSALMSGDARLGQELVEQMLYLAKRTRDPMSLDAAHFQLAGILVILGEFGRARGHLGLASGCFYARDSGRRALNGGTQLLPAGRGPGSIRRPGRSLQDDTFALAPMLTAAGALIALHLGFPDRARILIGEAVLKAERSGNAYVLALTHVAACGVCSLLRDPGALLGHADALSQLSQENSTFAGYAHYYACDALLLLGKVEEARERLTQQKAYSHLAGFQLLRQAALEAEAKICASEGRLDEALLALENALCEEVSYSKSPIMRLKADLMVRREDGVSEIETAYRDAIECAHRQENRFGELESTTHFARWLSSQNRGDEALTMLSEIYNWFTEGFDTLALKEAKVLLDEWYTTPA
jgi:tetratricopeptide (TPR) repeat protein